MNKYFLTLILSSILAFICSLLFTSFNELFLFVSFSCCLLFISLLFKKVNNHSFLFLILFVFKMILVRKLFEGVLLFNIITFFIGLIYNLKSYFTINEVDYDKKFNGFNLLFIFFLVISLFLPIYYGGVLFICCFINHIIISEIYFYYTLWRLKQNNIYVFNGNKFFDLSRVKTIIFNKTGVLTLGDLEIKNVVSDDDLFWEYLSYAEATRNDRIAELIKSDYRFIDVDISKRKKYLEFNNGVVYNLNRKKIIVGNSLFLNEHGIEIIEKDIGTFIYVVLNKKIIGYLEISDKVDLRNKSYIKELKKIGNYHFTVFSNDQKRLVNLVSKNLDIYDSYGDLRLKDKKFWHYYLKKQYDGYTLLISDDNDLDCDIKISFSSFSVDDVNKSDIIILDYDLSKVVLLLKMVRNLERMQFLLIWSSILGKGLILLISFLWISDLWIVAGLVILLSVLQIIIGLKRI